MRNAVFPFLTISDEHVECSPWRVRLASEEEEEWHEDPRFLEHWDNGTDLIVARDVRVATADAAKALELTVEQLELELIVTAGTGAGRLPTEKGILFRQPLRGDDDEAILEVRRRIKGRSLADALHLRTDLVQGTTLSGVASAISPRRRGDIVWQDATRIRLEGDVSQFPVTATDLAAVLGDTWKDALWCLEVDWDDVAAGFDAAVRLLVNERQAEFVKRFREGDGPTLQAVMADAMAQVVRGWLERLDEVDIDGADGDASSLAAVAAHWVALAFESPQAARHMLETAPGRFHARLNALAATPSERGG